MQSIDPFVKLKFVIIWNTLKDHHKKVLNNQTVLVKGSGENVIKSELNQNNLSEVSCQASLFFSYWDWKAYQK